MSLVHDRCICLRKVEYSETSQILTLFGRTHGRVQLIAKGAHRRTKVGASKFDGGIDLLDLGDAVFKHAPDRDLPPLTEWHQVDGHLEIHRNLRAMYLGLYSAELTNLLFEQHDPHVDLFDRLRQTLLDVGTAAREEAFVAFAIDLLREAGYLPELARCAGCQRTIENERERIYFAPSRGGVVCRACEGSYPDRLDVDPRLLRIVRSVIALPRVNGTPARLPRLTRHQTDPINRVFAGHIQHTLGKRLRMARWVFGGPAVPAPTNALPTAQTSAAH